ncbi:MAG: FHA domain-containing protein [Chromatiaceae bacterium]
MEDPNRTVLRATPGPGAAPCGVVVQWQGADGRPCERHFSTPFRLGRHSDCEVCLPVDSVSRHHAEVYREGTGWWIQDLGSANGTLLEGKRITREPLVGRIMLQLGESGPFVTLIGGELPPPRAARVGQDFPDDKTVIRRASAHGSSAQMRTQPPANLPRPAIGPERPAGPQPPPQAPRPIPPPRAAVEEIAERYFGAAKDATAGEHTQMVRQAFLLREKRRTRRQTAAFTVLGLLLAIAIGVSIWQNQKVQKANELAIDLFYDIKTLEVELARLEDRVRSTKALRLQSELAANRARLKKMLARYQKFVDEAESPEASLSPEDRTILRVARIFGECELNMPVEFKEEVRAYVRKWQATGRLQRGVRTAEENGYVGTIAKALEEHDLPPQFFYLGLQESGFNTRAVGPMTRWGVAKGAWQFLASTAVRYGLDVGPLKDIPEYDPADQRFDFTAATEAAARFLRDIYKTDAEASGLLVMASYNWGPANIIGRIRQMPDNPRERNFWKLLRDHNIPKETYDYVFYIVSAAVIGENPHLFGFDFNNPLRKFEKATLTQPHRNDST